MNIHNFFLTVQYITVSVLFLEILVVFLRWKNTVHSYLFFACIATFISNLGYLFEMKASCEESYYTALKLSYTGRVWIVFAFFLFTAKICNIKLPKILMYFLALIHIGIFISVLTFENHTLYYKDYSYIPDPVFPRFSHGNGILHDLLMAMNVLFMVMAMIWVINAYRKEKNRTSKLRLWTLILALGIQSISFILQVTGLFGISKYYDLTMPGELFGTIFLLVGIIRFNLLGTREIARDFVTDRISEGIIAVDKNGRIQYYNEPAARIFPEFSAFYSRNPLKKFSSSNNENTSEIQTSAKVHTPYDILSVITDAIQTGETLKIGGRIYTPEENDLIYNGENYGKLYALVDDTEHYQYMEELQKQRDIADNANEAKSRFLANMSHEIRTPINAVLGMDEMILREAEDKTIRAYASDIMSAGKTLLSLINDILDLSKVEEGKMEIIPVQYDLSSLINDLVNMTRDRAAKKGLQFNVQADKEIPHILYGDEIRIRQCAMNLLTNAVKYTETGKVDLRITFEKRDTEHIRLTVTVEDTGIGMKEEDMENLFSPYKRIEEKRNRAIEGTGLGMSITRQLLDLMGSSLQVHSEYGKGSVFSFTIDQTVIKWEELGDYSTRFNTISEQTHEYHELFHAPDAKILVVDDTEMNITVIQSLLKRTQIKIDAVMSGKEAIALASKNKYDVMFVDHMMPDMDGIETLKHIRESGESKDVPAVALTANAVSGAREMYLDAGFTDYLSKPVDGEKLEKLLADMIPAEKLQKPAATEENTTGVSETGSSFPDWLNEISEIDTQAGLKNCGSEDGYISVLTVFHRTAAVKAEEIENLYSSGDIENYTIKVHALKSSARIIGAASLSQLALSLEEAGKKNDLEYIQSNNDALLKMYRGLDEKLSGFDKKDEELPPIDEASLKEAYQTILEIAGGMDYGLMDGILKDLRGYSLPEADKERLLKIEGMLTQLDWDGIIKTAGERE